MRMLKRVVLILTAVLLAVVLYVIASAMYDYSHLGVH